jgi:protein SCO1
MRIQGVHPLKRSQGPGRRRGVLLLGLAAACGLSAQQEYQVGGTVEGIDGAQRQLIVAHDEIPGFMPAMTMNLDVAPEVALETLKSGDRIRFRLERSATTLRVLEVLQVEAGASQGLSGVERIQEPEGPAPDFRLRDQDDRPVALADLRGSIVLLDFIFTRCPGPCPILTARNVEVQRRLAQEGVAARFVSISLDPEHDQPPVLRAYAQSHGIDLRSWSLLTGTQGEVDAVLAAYGVSSRRVAADNLDHLVATFLIDADGRIERRYLGVAQKVEAIVADIRAL